MQSPNRKRKRNVRGYVGCSCPATMKIIPDPDESGGFTVTFTGIHNHDVQTDMLNFLNPIQVCRSIREMVDTKLYAGFMKSGKIRQDIQNELLRHRVNHKSYSQLRNFNMAIALETRDITNRRKQLCLDDELVHKNDAVAVEELIQTWERDLGKASPVRYFKQVGANNADTDDTNPQSDFNSDDFLIVMQSPDQAKMLVENPRIVCADATHGVTGYDYYLLSIVAIDKFGHGLVCGWAISSRENQRIWNLFVNNLLPDAKNIKPEVLMTDDANSAYNGMIPMWPSLRHKLLCHWHLKNNVRKRCMACKVPSSVSLQHTTLPRTLLRPLLRAYCAHYCVLRTLLRPLLCTANITASLTAYCEHYCVLRPLLRTANITASLTAYWEHYCAHLTANITAN